MSQLFHPLPLQFTFRFIALTVTVLWELNAIVLIHNFIYIKATLTRKNTVILTLRSDHDRDKENSLKHR